MSTLPLLKDTPRPHYLVSATISEDNFRLEGDVVFPTDDVTIADRKDHVNSAHFEFAMWNAAHLLAPKYGIDRSTMRVNEIIKTFEHLTLPDEKIKMVMEVTSLSDSPSGRSVTGSAEAEFRTHDGQPIAHIHIKTFKALKL